MLQDTALRLRGAQSIADDCLVVCNETHRFLVAEQLRAIEHGYSIITGNVTHCCEGIDTQEQYNSFVKRWTDRNGDES